jgi:hypothetical protein
MQRFTIQAGLLALIAALPVTAENARQADEDGRVAVRGSSCPAPGPPARQNRDLSPA